MLAFSHPIYAHTAYERATLATRRAMHTRAATVVQDERAIAHHLVAGDAVTDDEALRCVRSAANDALARGAWEEAARYFEAALTRPHPPGELAELHRRAGLSRRGNLQLAPAVVHFETALRLLGPDADAATRAELHLWRIRCGIGTREMLGVVADRGPLEALVDEVEADDPELAAEALVELSQSYWVEWHMKQATQCAHRAMAIANEHDDHSTYTARHHRAERAAVGSATTCAVRSRRWRTASPTRAPRTTTRCSRAARCSGCHWCSPGWGGSTRPNPHAGVLRHRRARAVPVGARAPPRRAHADRGARAESSTRPSSTRTAPCSCSDSRATTGLQASSCLRSRARTSPAGSTRRHATRSPPGRRRPTSSSRRSVDLFSRWVDACERRLVVQGAPLPGLPRDPLIGADAWAVLAVELAQREGGDRRPPGRSRPAGEDRGARRRDHRRHRDAGGPSPRRRAGSPRRRGRRGRHAAARDRNRPRAARRARGRPRPGRTGGDPAAPG